MDHFSECSPRLITIIDNLQKHELSKAYNLISEEMHDNMDSPIPHNLLGIYYEISRDDCSARKHYRAAYALDPTYKPACRNLERIISFNRCDELFCFDYGFQII